MIPKPKFSAWSSTRGQSLEFVTKAEYLAYEKDIQAVIDKHKKIIRDKYGIWANNQGRFVKHESELNQFDSREYV